MQKLPAGQGGSEPSFWPRFFPEALAVPGKGCPPGLGQGIAKVGWEAVGTAQRG